MTTPTASEPRRPADQRPPTELDHDAAALASSCSLAPAPRFDHVLLPLDGSEFSLAARATANALAVRFGAELHTIGVHDGNADKAERLRQFGETAIGESARNGSAAVIAGTDPAEEIVRHAEQLGNTLVCISAHGRGRLGGALVGSVTTAVLQRSPQPVVVVGPTADRPGWSPVPAAWPPPLTIDRVVACVDGSPASEQVLPAAGAWASALQMGLTILTVADDMPAALRPERAPTPYGTHGDPDRYVHDLVTNWNSSIPTVTGLALRDPISVESGVRDHLLHQRPASLVAVTTRARSGMQRLRLGSVATSIINASLAPCLVVPVRG